MLDTRTPSRTHRTGGDLPAFAVHTKGPGWTARTASPPGRTVSAAHHKAKKHSSSIVCGCWTAWTAISGVFMMRVHLHVRNPSDGLCDKLNVSHHIKLGIICPSCPIVDFIKLFQFFLSNFLSIIGSLSVQSVQKLSRGLKNENRYRKTVAVGFCAGTLHPGYR